MWTEGYDEAFAFLQMLLHIVQFPHKLYINVLTMIRRINSDHFHE